MTNGKDIGFGIRSRMQARHLLQVPWKTEPEARLGAASLLGVGEPGLESGGKCSRKGWEKIQSGGVCLDPCFLKTHKFSHRQFSGKPIETCLRKYH